VKTLSREDLASRRVFDYRIVARMSRPPYAFTAYRTPQGAQTGTDPILTERDACYAAHYRAEYSIRTLRGPNQYSNHTVIRIDASAAGYPFESPSAWVVENSRSQTPWSPHFARGSSTSPICSTGMRSSGMATWATTARPSHGGGDI
jgi:hypothetical protein